MRIARRAELPGDAAGDWALSLGVVALVVWFAPMVGELLALAAAAGAIGLGLLGIRRHERGEALRVAPAIAGAVMGTLAVMILTIVLIATYVRP